MSLQPFSVGHLSWNRYVLFGLCNVDEASLSVVLKYVDGLSVFCGLIITSSVQL